MAVVKRKPVCFLPFQVPTALLNTRTKDKRKILHLSESAGTVGKYYICREVQEPSGMPPWTDDEQRCVDWSGQ